MLSPKLAEALGRTSQKINDIECAKFIWWHFYQMYRILRKDTAQLKPGHPVSSTNVEDYEFGLHDSEITRYVYHANMFHALMINDTTSFYDTTSFVCVTINTSSVEKAFVN